MPIISLQVFDDLLERFEKLRTVSGFNSKSEALREAIVNFIEIQENFDNISPSAYKIMNISLVYPFKEGLIDEISEIYSQYRQIIKTITDWRIVEKKIEVILAVGEFGRIKNLKNSLDKLKDVICSINEIIID